jgi:hypothetical protein
MKLFEQNFRGYLHNSCHKVLGRDGIRKQENSEVIGYGKEPSSYRGMREEFPVSVIRRNGRQGNLSVSELA